MFKSIKASLLKFCINIIKKLEAAGWIALVQGRAQPF